MGYLRAGGVWMAHSPMTGGLLMSAWEALHSLGIGHQVAALRAIAYVCKLTQVHTVIVLPRRGHREADTV